MAPKKALLLACGSFNPPTNMHLRLFELAKDHLRAKGIDVLGGIISPVNDAYEKKGLLSAQHRIKMAELAVQKYDFVRCSKWEVEQSQWIRTRNVLDEYRNQLAQMAKTGSGPNWLPNFELDDKEELPQIFLVCGGDLIETFSVPGLWQETDITAIVRDYGLVVITREGSNPEKYVYDHDILHHYRDNIHLITERIPNDLSSTRIRKAIKRDESIRFLVPDLVIDYIEENCLYKQEPNSDNEYLAKRACDSNVPSVDVSQIVNVEPSSLHDEEICDSSSMNNVPNLTHPIIVENPCMTPPSVDTFDIIDTTDVDTEIGSVNEDGILNVSSSPINLVNEISDQVESSSVRSVLLCNDDSFSKHETDKPKRTPSPCNLPPLNEDNDDVDEEEDCSCTTTGSRSPTPVQFEITPKGVKVISDKESFL